MTCMRLRPILQAFRPRPFTTLGASTFKNLPSRPRPPPDSEIEESYLKGSGPGGQKINKTNSAVQLKHPPTGIVVKSQATRSRSQNRKLAREILAQKIDDLVNGEQSRSAIVGDLKKKKADSAAKKSRRKYRKLEGDKDQEKEKQQEEVEGKEGKKEEEEEAVAAVQDTMHNNHNRSTSGDISRTDSSHPRNQNP